MNKYSGNNKKKSFYPEDPYEEENDDSWQISYLDIITIVLGFLIILLSVSQIRKSALPSLSTLFGKKSDETEYITTPIEEIKTELDSLLQDQIALGNIEIERDLNDLRIRFKGDDFYRSGSTTLEPKARLILEDVLMAFQEINRNDFNIDVEGHTDNVPIRNSSFPSNWELSTARASNVVKYFRENGINEKRLKASGYADSRPVIQFDSLGYPFAASKDMNRRVVLRLFYSTDNLMAADRDSTAVDSAIESEQSVSELAQALAEQARRNPVSESRQSPIVETPGSVDEDPVREPEAETTSPPVEDDDEPVTESTVIREADVERVSKPAPASVPSFTQDNSSCNFAVEAERVSMISRGFQRASDLQTETGLSFELTPVGDDFSVRTTSRNSVLEALTDLQAIRGSVSGAALIHQCASRTEAIPGSLTYQIQFGAFQNEQNALDYSLNLLDEYGIQAYMTRSSNTYNVVTGPYNSRNEVSEKINEFRETGVRNNIFIKPVQNNEVAYGYLYQIQVASASVPADLENVQRLVQSNSGVSTDIVQVENSRYLLLSPQYSSQQEVNSVLSSIRRNNRQLAPVLYLLEYY